MVGDMRRHRVDAAAIEILELFLPGAVAVLRPLKGQLMQHPLTAKLVRLRKDGPKNLPLQIGHARLADWAADRKVDETGPRRLYRKSDIPDGAHAHRRQTSRFETARDQSHGPMTLRS